MTTAFLPCRAGSQRVKRKNTRVFAGDPQGLVGIKLGQLARCGGIERIVLSTNDPEVVAIALSLSHVREKLEIDHRPEELCLPTTSTDELIRYVPTIIQSGPVLWTHVTSPLVTSLDYESILVAYNDGVDSGKADSLMTVTSFQEFLWSTSGPLNYDPLVEKWPRTQFLKPLFTVNSAAFVIDAQLMASHEDRIGASPVLHELDGLKGFDIDWEGQFEVGELLYARAIASRISSS
jgi:CMP-N-acetylneuraminic acid synthetase